MELINQIISIKSVIIENLNITSVVDIFILFAIIYRTITLIEGTRTIQVMVGMLMILIIYFLANLFNLYAVYSVLNLFLNSLVVIIVVLFANEIKRGLLVFSHASKRWRKEKLADPYLFDKLYQACEYCVSNYTGALITIEKNQPLRQYADSGTVLNARLSSPLLVSIFNKESPLHDGAVIINKDLKIYAAACILPLTSRIDLKIKMGTRHRSAIGISEETDCLVIVISEESGVISFFEDGRQEIVPLSDFIKILKIKII